MKKCGRSKSDSVDRLKKELVAKANIEENNIFLSASLAYFFVVLYASLTEQVERSFGIILILTSIMIIWYFMDKRKEIRRKIEAW
jgi:Ca2+/Na+ antiporter